MISELRFATLLIVIGLIASIAVYDNTGTNQARSNGSPEDPPSMVFSPTGDYVAGDLSMPLVLHSFELTPTYLAVVYTLVGDLRDTPQSFSPAIVDDKGRTYRVLSNGILGSADGVLAGLLVVESHISGGSVLTIQAQSAELAGGISKGGPWSMPFLKTAQPDGPITFIEGGRLSPEEGVHVNGATVGIAGPPGSSPVEVLISRAGKTTSLYGAVDNGGTTGQFDQEDFQRTTGISGYPKPPAFPSGAVVVR